MDSKDFNGWFTQLFRQVIDSIMYPLTAVINEFLVLGYVSDCLDIAKTIPIFKKCDASSMSLKELPANLLPFSCQYKIIESVLLKHAAVYL